MDRSVPTFSLIPFLLALLPVGAWQETVSPDLETTIGVIRQQEGNRDPKCHASATRLENFMFGTPLTSEARHHKVALQKGLILALWQEAASGSGAITAEKLTPLLQARMPHRTEADGSVIIRLSDGRELRLSAVDVRQYSSVAYALRAILAVQQDQMLASGPPLPLLDESAVEALKTFVDLYTLAALDLADRAARGQDANQLDPGLLEKGWRQVSAQSGQIETEKKKQPARSVAGQPVLRRIVAQKLSSYEAYNQVSSALVWSNVRRYFARLPWPLDKAMIQQVQQAFSSESMNYIAEVLLRSQNQARSNNQAVIDGPVVEAVVDRIVPFKVNVYEDVIFFHHLAREQQVTLESYDVDSFRDGGFHWQFIRIVLDAPSLKLELDLDPFAAELLAEGTAQYAVLLFRVAGDLARAEDFPFLKAEYITRAAAEIRNRSALHARTPEPVAQAPALISTTATTGSEQPFFEDATDRVGIDFMHRSSDWLNRFQRSFLYVTHGKKFPDAPEEESSLGEGAPAFSGSGVAAEDVDGDGDPDILLTGGLGNRLYLNRGNGTFMDGTAESGLVHLEEDGFPAEPRQPLIVDFDNDGLPDILLTNVNAAHRLYRNLGGGRFQDMTDTARLGGRGLIGSAAVAFDYDNDGLLDLYLCYYGNYLEGIGPNVVRDNHNATPNRLFRNLGGMRFRDVSKGSGTQSRRWSQAVGHTDFDLDGRQDLIVGNDFGLNEFYRNLGNGRFEDISVQLGTDVPSNSMNVGIADLNGDLHPDIYISNILALVKDEKYVLPNQDTRQKRKVSNLASMRVAANNHLFLSARKENQPLRYEVSDFINRGEISTGWAWDADFFDFDNDGDDDLYCVNGFNEYNQIAQQAQGVNEKGEKETQMFSIRYNESNVFFVNQGGKLENRTDDSGAGFYGNSRAAAYLDFDLDGDLDIVVNNYHERAVFLVNNSERFKRHWLKVRLVGDPEKGITRDAIGARLVLRTPGGRQVWREVHGGIGYLSMHPKQQHFGLGDETTASLTIYWPDGSQQELSDLKADTAYVIDRAKGLRKEQ